jgi:formate dehydrogenase major subunit
MNAPLPPGAVAPAVPVRFQLDGTTVEALPGETLIECADRNGIAIPRLCYKPGYRPDGNCRACMVEIEGERVLAASCCRAATEGMRVSTASERARASQRMVLELLRADMPAQETKPHSAQSELEAWCVKLDVKASRFGERAQPRADLSHGLMAVNLDACIQCTRCVRACREEQVNDVIGFAFRGEETKVVFDLDDPMGESTCVSCGECVQACPTGALSYANGLSKIVPDRQVDTVCGYCGVGCAITLNIKDEKIVSVDGRDAEANHGRLCVKGRFGIPQLVHNATRLGTPLVRAGGDRRNPLVPATWDEAFDLIAAKLKPFIATDEFAIIGCWESTNEEQYLTSKFGRAGMKTNNVSSVAHLCHANTVRGLIPLFGSGAQSLPHDQISEAQCLLLIGNNPAETHPVVGNEIKQAVKKGAKLIVANPRRTGLHRFASLALDLKPGTDVPLVMAMCRVIVEENLYDAEYVSSRTVGFEAFLDNVREYDIDCAAQASGVPRETIVAAACMFATHRPGVVLWGMGIAQHSHGSQNVWALGNLCLLTGNMGVHGGGIAPLRGHSNVMGATDMSLTTAWYPGYQMCPGYETIPGLAQFPNMHEKFEKAGTPGCRRGAGSPCRRCSAPRRTSIRRSRSPAPTPRA